MIHVYNYSSDWTVTFKDSIKDVDINGLQQNKAEHQLTSFSVIAAYKYCLLLEYEVKVLCSQGQKNIKKNLRPISLIFGISASSTGTILYRQFMKKESSLLLLILKLKGLLKSTKISSSYHPIS